MISTVSVTCMHLEATMTAQPTNQQTVMRVDRKVTQYNNNTSGILHDFHPCIFICLLGGKKLIGPLHYSLIPFYNFTTRSCCFLDRLDRQKPLVVYANYFKLTNSLGNGHSYEVKVLLTWRCKLKIHTQLHILLKFYILCEQLFYGLRTRILRDEKNFAGFFSRKIWEHPLNKVRFVRKYKEVCSPLFAKLVGPCEGEGGSR